MWGSGRSPTLVMGLRADLRVPGSGVTPGDWTPWMLAQELDCSCGSHILALAWLRESPEHILPSPESWPPLGACTSVHLGCGLTIDVFREPHRNFSARPGLRATWPGDISLPCLSIRGIDPAGHVLRTDTPTAPMMPLPPGSLLPPCHTLSISSGASSLCSTSKGWVPQSLLYLRPLPWFMPLLPRL